MTDTDHTTTPPNEREHPFVLVSEELYPALRERATEEPWKTWKERARRMVETELGGDSFRPMAKSAFERASGATLSYVLAPERREEYARALLEAIRFYHAEVFPEMTGGRWGRVVYPSGAFFALVLGLDIVQPVLSKGEIDTVEESLAEIADWYWERRSGAWEAARYGAYGVWAVYEGDAHRIQTAADRLLEDFEGDWQDEGVYPAGCEYANNRFHGRWCRNTKAHLLDVLAFATGIDLYENEAIRRDFEWTLGYSMTPIVHTGDPYEGRTAPQRDCYTFGDSGPHHVLTSSASATYRAGKFGGAVDNNAAWALVGENPAAATNTPAELPPDYVPPNRNVFVSYILTESVPSDPDPIPSRIFREGGAWFHADSTDTETLAGALWNVTRAGGAHTHLDTNAIHLCAYGEHLLRNAGYTGFGNPVEEFPWSYVNDRAIANNVALADYQFEDDTAPPEGGHVERAGAGITEGFVGPVSYACGDSANALSDGTHRRNFVFVPAGDGANGYWLLFDEIDAPDAETVHTALHPNSATAPTVEGDRLAYTTPVGGPFARSDNGVELTIAYGTRPQRVETRRGALADWDESFVGTYLYATYAAEDAMTQLTTALLPHDDRHERADGSRLSGERFSGVELRQGGVIDRAIGLDGEASIAVDGIETKGKAALVREIDGEPGLYFVRQGTKLSHGTTGFEAGEAISLAVENGVGNVVAPTETRVRFDEPGVSGVEIDEQAAKLHDSGEGYVETVVPAGDHDLRLV